VEDRGKVVFGILFADSVHSDQTYEKEYYQRETHSRHVSPLHNSTFFSLDRLILKGRDIEREETIFTTTHSYRYWHDV
jgi:hypothetical protein